MTRTELHFDPPAEPLLSVAVLLTRGTDLVEPCLQSIARALETAPPSEVVLVLASDDPETRELVRERVHGATVVEAPPGLNVGLAPAQNLLFANARGRWVVLLHEDSQPAPGALETLVAAAEGDPAAAVVGARFVTAHGDLQQAGAVLWSDGRVMPVHGEVGQSRAAAGAPYPIDSCGMAGTLIERAAWQAVGGFDERFFPAFMGDIDFCLSIWGHGRSVLCEPRAVVRHDRGAMVDRGRGSTKSLDLRKFLGGRQHDRFVEKWGGALPAFARPADTAREPEAAAVENAVVHNGAAQAYRAGLLEARVERQITRPDGQDARAIDSGVEARLLKAQVDMLRDFADHLHAQANRPRARPAPLASGPGPRVPSAAEAQAFLDRADFHWGQRWELAPGVFTPGGYDVSWLLGAIGVPADLTGMSVLDIASGNGAAAFEAERRGADRVLAVDGPAPDAFGAAAVAELLGSRVEYLQAPAYEVAELLGGERFDLVLCLGLLPHLRHPLLALDAFRSVTAGELLIETAVSDHELGDSAGEPLARFYRRDELGGDPTNWFAPTSAALLDWCTSCGFVAELAGAWPDERPERVAVRCRPAPGIPEWQRLGAA